MNPDSSMGAYAMLPSDYDELRPFFSKALAKYHGVPEDATHVNDWSLDGVEGLPSGGVLDLAALGLPELSMRVRVGRNLKAFPLPGAMTKSQRLDLENFMLKVSSAGAYSAVDSIGSRSQAERLSLRHRHSRASSPTPTTAAGTAPSPPATPTSWTRPSTRLWSMRTSPSRTCRPTRTC